MKRILAMVLTMTMLLCLTSQIAFATEKVEMGNTYVVTDDFMDGTNIVSHSWTTDAYTVSARYTKGAKYVEQPFIDDADNTINIKVKPSTELTSTTTIEGIVTVYDVQERKRYKADISFLAVPGQALYINEIANKEFILPGSYSYGPIRFYDVDSKNKYGTLNAEFISDNDSSTIAYFDVKIADQKSLILSHNEKQIVDILKKNEVATMRFIEWDTRPKFDATGTLGIVMESDEYLYKIGAENKLTAVSGTYNKDRGTFDFKTNTLEAYVISDTKLSATAAASSSSSSVAASVAPPPASSSKPVASSVAPAPSSSSVAPSSSSTAPESSSSSEPESSSSEPAPEPSSEPEPEPSSSSTATVPDKDKDEGKGGFPVLPVAIGLGVVVIGGVAAYFIFNNRSGGKKNYDTWDD